MSASINKVVLLGGAAGAGTGDVVGPASATDNAVVRFDGTTGKVVQNSAVTIADTTGAMTFANTGSFISLAGTSPSTGVGTGALQVAGGIYAGAASYFGGAVTIGGNLTLPTASAATTRYIITAANNDGTIVFQNGVGSAAAGGSLQLSGSTHATRPGWVTVGLGSGSTRKFTVSDSGIPGGSDVFTVAASGDAAFAGAVTAQGLFYPQQATTAGAPAYVKGAIYFDTTLNKLRVGGATAWETVTSV